MFTKISLLFVLFSLPQMLLSQIRCEHQIVPSLPPDSLDLAYYGKKQLGRSIAGVLGVNTAIWSFNRFVMREDFAFINKHTIRENFRRGFVWDNDNLGTNMFFHPYHGNLYFNAARSNGYNYWQSGLFAFGGSAMWELFMESEYPSTNDIIATPIGGMALGETFYRISDLILDDRSMGRERTGREVAAFLVSPMRGLMRIINGDAWRHRPTSGRQFGIPDLSVAFSVGTRVLELEKEILDRGVGIASEVSVEYGDRFSTERERPYDFFTMNVGLNIQKSQPFLGQVNLVGRLWNRELMEKTDMVLNAGLYQHFDFYDSNVISDVSSIVPYRIAIPASVGGGMQFQCQKVGNWEFSASMYGNGILMGAVLSDHYRLADRNYNIASGFGTKSGLMANYQKGKFIASLSHEFYRFFTWKGYDRDIDWAMVDSKSLDAQGDESQSSVHICELRLDYRLMKRLFITGSLMHFHRDTNYRYYSDVRSSSTSARLMLTFVI